MDNFFLKKGAETEECNFYIIIFSSIVKNILKAEKEESKLTLRKNNLQNLLSSKRKINFSKETDSRVDEEYLISLNDISIPEELKIDINKFYQYVNNSFI